MNNLVEYMNELDIRDNKKLINYIQESSVDTLVTFLDYCREIVFKDWVKKTYSPFSFVPSSDLSGTGGCFDVNCKIKRANAFARYAALYSDNVYLVINNLTFPYNIDDSENSIKNFKYELISDFSIINTYSPLIEQGIISIVPQNFHLCKNCFLKMISSEEDLKNLDIIKNNFSDKAQIIVNKISSNKKKYIVRVENLEEIFPEHVPLFEISSGSKLIDELEHIFIFPYTRLSN